MRFSPKPLVAGAWSANAQALYDRMEVNIGDAAGRHRELIPDGQLCGDVTVDGGSEHSPLQRYPVQCNDAANAPTNRRNLIDGRSHGTPGHRIHSDSPAADRTGTLLDRAGQRRGWRRNDSIEFDTAVGGTHDASARAVGGTTGGDLDWNRAGSGRSPCRRAPNARRPAGGATRSSAHR